MGTGVLFSHQGALVELYCHWAYWFCGGGFPLWKDGLLNWGQKLLNPPGEFLCIELISCRDLVMLITLVFRS